MPRKTFLAGSLLALALIALALVWLSPSPLECDGSGCAYLVTPYDTIRTEEKSYRTENGFRENIPMENVSIYIENSVSMDAYLGAYTKFKEITDRLQSSAANVAKTVDCFYLNNTLKKYSGSPSRFARYGLTPTCLAEAGGDRSNTELSDVIETVIKENKDGQVSVLISDFVPSPGGASVADIQNYISSFSERIKGIIKKKVFANPRTCVMLCRYDSEFNGKFFWADNSHIHLEGERPFYALFVGDYGLIAKLKRESKMMNDTKADCLYFASQRDIPYGAYSGQFARYTTPKHLRINKHLKLTESMKEKAESQEGALLIKLKMDLSCLPIDPKEFLDTSRYAIDSPCFYIARVGEASAKEKDNYTHVLTLKSKKATFPDHNKLTVHFKKKAADWKEYSTLNGKQSLSGQDAQRTLGIESFRESIEKAFKVSSSGSDDYAVFELLIN